MTNRNISKKLLLTTFVTAVALSAPAMVMGSYVPSYTQGTSSTIRDSYNNIAQEQYSILSKQHPEAKLTLDDVKKIVDFNYKAGGDNKKYTFIAPKAALFAKERVRNVKFFLKAAEELRVERFLAEGQKLRASSALNALLKVQGAEEYFKGEPDKNITEDDKKLEAELEFKEFEQAMQDAAKANQLVVNGQVIQPTRKDLAAAFIQIKYCGGASAIQPTPGVAQKAMNAVKVAGNAAASLCMKPVGVVNSLLTWLGWKAQ